MSNEWPTLVLIGSDQPLPEGPGRSWRAIDGEPAFRRVLVLKPGEAPPDPAAFGAGASVWTGVQIDTLPEVGDPAGAEVLLAVGQEPAPGHEPEFNAWMDDEHVPGLAGVPGTLSAHRYRSETGSPEYFAVYHLRDLDVNASPEWRSVGSTPRSAEMKQHSRKRVRGLYVPE